MFTSRLIIFVVACVFAAGQPLRVVAQSETSPSTPRNNPQVLQAALAGGWTDESLNLSVRVPQGIVLNDAVLLSSEASPNDVTSSKLPSIKTNNEEIQFKGTWNQFSSVLVGGTRSLWVRGQTDQFFRIDLPAPNVRSAKLMSGNTSRGPTVTVSIEGLLPGFAVLCAAKPQQKQLDGESLSLPSTEYKVQHAGRRFPRLSTIVHDRAAAIVTLRFSDIKADDTPIEYLLTFVNRDGSASQTLKLVQSGDSFAKERRLFESAGRCQSMRMKLFRSWNYLTWLTQ